MVAAAAPAAAADLDPSLPPAVVAAFTQRVQPLLINHCGAGGCHGGPEAPAPKLQRGAGNRQPDRSHTRANLAAFLKAVGPVRDAKPLAALLADGHPKAGPRPRQAAPLTTSERVTLDRWLAEVREAERRVAHVDSGVVPASAEMPEPVPQAPNRFRALLDAAANPPELPPPEEPKGVIFKNDVPPED